jgi:hypothetical protein
MNLYNFCVSIPDYLYPFVEEIEGERVRFRAAYDQALARIQEDKGYGHYGAFLVTYRGICHIVGATLFIGFATLVSRDLFGSDIALYSLLIMATVALTFQEFYLQPRTFGQMKAHSVIDLMSWVVPFGVFIFIHLH